MGKGRHHQKNYHEIRGYRLSDININENDVAKENYYALAIAVCTGLSTDSCLAKMGIGVDRKEYNRKQEAPFIATANISYVLNVICGMTQRDISLSINKGYWLVRDGINYIRGIKRKRRNASRLDYGSKKYKHL